MQDTRASCQPPRPPLLQEKSRSPARSVPQFTQHSEGRHQMGFFAPHRIWGELLVFFFSQ